ncbi:hypothetical protein FJ364_04145, partial [Candidatus Dependentiae bacterium]|nr:hypothetical protein [Candidatus Dependentiae bacterium]
MGFGQRQQKAKDFFTNKLGLKLSSESDNYGWFELKAETGDFLFGVGECNDFSPIKAGHNVVLTMNVEDIVSARKELEEKGVETVGDIEEIPGHVKM